MTKAALEEVPTVKKSEFLSLDEIISAPDVQYKVVSVPEWGGQIRIGSLSSGDMLEWIEANEGARRTAGLRLIVKSLVDGEGNRIGSDRNLEQFKKKDARVCNRVVEEILELNGMNPKQQEKAKNDSGETPTGASPTVSP